MNILTAPHNGTDTSIEASESIVEHLGRLEKTVLQVIRHNRGATCDEVEAIAGLSHQTASARVNQLARRGLIYDSGERRLTRSKRRAAVYRAVAVQCEPFRS